MSKILIIEDDVSIGEMMSIYLYEDGYEVKRAENGRQGEALFREFQPDMIILDLMLPDMDGIHLCTTIRHTSNIPILMVSAKNEVSDRVKGLQTGADDYLCKPFSMRELSARIQALLRRSNTFTQQSLSSTDVLKQQGIQLDFEKRCLYVDGKNIETTFSEFEIMKLFWQNQGRVYSREELLNRVRGFDSQVTERAIDVHIANLRKKVEDDPKEPKHIKTVWGVGYKFLFT
ncbi:response regulator transcription factor [Paenibacillus qinlingensis]|uniref:DNA-binding response OmpR family regulator n=1 Tax=Paenibacillus qinlingensis TaxID=1837343 RepID=A0ABU1P2W5_9BACL|nr:response regulator transcription factor [Paenibacillus qinlingensis]MDR6554081.1 DNA-binding response OmpR family regulator [Paenibacillus qinlingensis]